MIRTPKLITDEDGGSGLVKWPPNWDGRSWIERADLLKDWIEELSEVYAMTVREFGQR